MLFSHDASKKVFLIILFVEILDIFHNFISFPDFILDKWHWFWRSLLQIKRSAGQLAF